MVTGDLVKAKFSTDQRRLWRTPLISIFGFTDEEKQTFDPILDMTRNDIGMVIAESHDTRDGRHTTWICIMVRGCVGWSPKKNWTKVCLETW